MSATVKCKCGFDVHFTDEERGLFLYCDSCGAEIEIPLLTAQQQTPIEPPGPLAPVRRQSATASAAATVFGEASGERLQQRVVAHVTCLCGERNPVRLEEYGSTIYCASCQGELETAAAIGAERPYQRLDDVVAEPPSRVIAEPRHRVSRNAIIVPLTVFCSLAIAIAGWKVWRAESTEVQVPRAAFTVEPAKASVVPDGEFDIADLSDEAIERIACHSDPFLAISYLRGWKHELAKTDGAASDPWIGKLDTAMRDVLAKSETTMLDMIDELPQRDNVPLAIEVAQSWHETLAGLDVDEQDPRRVRLRKVSRVLYLRQHPITLEMIDELRTRQDVNDALRESQLWKEILSDAVESADPRITRVDEVIENLRDKLAEPAEPPPRVIADFRDELQQLALALKNGQLRPARGIIADCETMLQEHAGDLADLKERFDFLKQRAERLEALQPKVQRVREMLQQVQAELEASNLASAILLQARARHLAKLTVMTEPDEAALKSLALRINAEVNLARGIRAADEAVQANSGGDVATRHHCVRRAYVLLSGLREDKIAPHIAKVSEWKTPASIAPPLQITSALGQAISVREQLEATFEKCAEAEMFHSLELARATYDELLAGDVNSIQQSQQLIEFVLLITEDWLSALEDGVSRVHSAADESKQEALRVLNHDWPWRNDPRWQALATKIQ